MSGMRHRESGRDCPCCSQWAPTRASEKRDWRKAEFDQAAPWDLLPARRRTPSYAGFLETLWLTYGYWAVERGDY